MHGCLAYIVTKTFGSGCQLGNYPLRWMCRGASSYQTSLQSEPTTELPDSPKKLKVEQYVNNVQIKFFFLSRYVNNSSFNSEYKEK